MLASSPEADVLTNLTSHYVLLEHVISCQLGHIAGKIIHILRDHTLLTLKEIAEAVLPKGEENRNQVQHALDARDVRSALYLSDDAVFPSTTEPANPSKDDKSARNTSTNGLMLLTDAAMKELITRLVLHRVVVHDAEARGYALSLGCGIFLHVFYPLIAQTARARYGEAGEVIALILRQLALIPWDAAIRLAGERRPGLSSTELLRAARLLERDDWVEFLTRAGGFDGGGPSSLKRGRFEEDGDAHAAALRSDAARLCVEVILLDLLHNATLQWLREHYVDHGLASAVVAVFLGAARQTFIHQRRAREGGGGFRPHGYPRLPLAGISPRLSPAVLHDALASGAANRAGAAISLSAVVSAVEALSEASSNLREPFLLRCGDLAAREATAYRLDYPAVVRTLQKEACERVLFARHGVLGIRLLKLLLRDHLLEDRTLAEAAIATQPRTRETLHGMLRDGFVFIQEAPRGSALSEQRVVKNSIFLWGSDFERAVRPNVREQLAKTLHHALVKLREVVEKAEKDNEKDNRHRNRGEETGATLGGHSMLHVVRGEAPTPTLPTSHDGTDSPADAVGREGKVSEEVSRRTVQTQRSIVGLESCAASLMRLLLLVDYY